MEGLKKIDGTIDIFKSSGKHVNLLIEHAVYTEQDGYNAKFFNCWFKYVTFKRMNFFRLIFENCVFEDCVFDDFDLMDVIVSDCSFATCLFYYIRIGGETNVHDCMFAYGTTASRIGFGPVVDVQRNRFDSTCFGFGNICPSEGSFIAWKKAYARIVRDDYMSDEEPSLRVCPVIVKLQITADSKRSNAFSRKCRCSEAIVLELQDIEGNTLPSGTRAYSAYDNDFRYMAGETVHVATFDENPLHECSEGIHFFIDRREAVEYAI